MLLWHPQLVLGEANSAAFHSCCFCTARLLPVPSEERSSLSAWYLQQDFLKKFHHALLEVHLEEGALVCPETGKHSPALLAPAAAAAVPPAGDGAAAGRVANGLPAQH